jgi:hypothetical protein
MAALKNTIQSLSFLRVAGKKVSSCGELFSSCGELKIENCP